MRARKVDDNVVLDLVTFRPMQDKENAPRFFKLFESRGGVFLPEVVEFRRNRRTYRLHYQKGDAGTWSQCWGVGGFTLSRSAPMDMLASLTIWPDKAGTPGANWLVIWLPAAYFSTTAMLNDLVEFGNTLCGALSPCYGFIVLPSMPRLKVVSDPDRGLPGLGWATWLGPEYESILNLNDNEEIHIKHLSSGERLVLCPEPQEVARPGERVRNALESFKRQLPEGILQPEEGKASLVPTFRFKEERSIDSDEEIRLDEKAPESEPIVIGSEARSILAKYEPDFLDNGVPNGIGGAIFFSGLTQPEAKRLLELLPKSQGEVSTESSPTFREISALADRFPNLQYYGYRLLPQIGNERVVISGFFLPKENVTPSTMKEIESLQPDEVEWDEYEGRSVLRVGWE